jgi:hypothetical protein
MGQRYANLSESEKGRHIRGASAAREAQRLGGRGYAPTKRMVDRGHANRAADERTVTMRAAGEIDPSTNSAARSLSGLKLDDDADFDHGIRLLRGSLRRATVADKVSESIQDVALTNHDETHRDSTGALRDVPHAVTSRTFKHVRGSFPMAMEAIATLGKSKGNVNFTAKMTEKLTSLRRKLHRPAVHELAPPISKTEARIARS